MPALFFLTLIVTFPSLYVFNALVGSKLSLTSLLRLLVASLGVMMALLASFGTIAVFFAVTLNPPSRACSAGHACGRPSRPLAAPGVRNSTRVPVSNGSLRAWNSRTCSASSCARNT